MLCRMYTVLLKQFLSKSNAPAKKYGYKYLVSSATAVSQNEKQDLNDLIQVANKLKPLINRPVNELLSDIDLNDTTPSESVNFLKALRIQKLFNNVSPENFKSDSRFHLLCDVFQKSCDTLNLPLIISGLRSLLEVGMPADSPCVVTAETRILINCQTLDAFNLIRCLHFHHKFMKSDLQKQVVLCLREELVKKISKVSAPSEVLPLCQIYDLFSETNRKKIEQKIIELVPSLNGQEMCKVIISLAQKSNRNVSILNSVAFHMWQKQENLDFKEIVNVLYAFKKLNYMDSRLLSRLSKTAVEEIPKITQPSLISGLLTTCGYLKWRHTELLDACAEWLKTNSDTCRAREFTAFILSTAALNYSTPGIKNVLNSIIPSLFAKQIESNILLDVAWSLAIHDSLPKNLLLSVLSSEFYKPLLDVPDFQMQTTTKLKLMNLKGVLKIKYPEHVFGCNLYLEPIKLKESSEIENSRKHVVNVLSNFVPKDKCLCTNQSNDMGIFIDAEFIMDKDVKPLSLAEYGVVSSTMSTKPLPPGAKRLALLVMFHKDYTQRTKTLTGVNYLAAKLLSHLGYLVVTVPYEEFLKNKTEVQKAKYLMEKIRKSVQNTKENLQ